jgi:hypothetical protein
MTLLVILLAVGAFAALAALFAPTDPKRAHRPGRR